ncbi:MAG: hypothetical protein WC495_04635 [Patescibacteria group bacterium]|jgi:hypothetical protein
MSIVYFAWAGFGTASRCKVTSLKEEAFAFRLTDKMYATPRTYYPSVTELEVQLTENGNPIVRRVRHWGQPKGGGDKRSPYEPVDSDRFVEKVTGDTLVTYWDRDFGSNGNRLVPIGVEILPGDKYSVQATWASLVGYANERLHPCKGYEGEDTDLSLDEWIAAHRKDGWI